MTFNTVKESHYQSLSAQIKFEYAKTKKFYNGLPKKSRKIYLKGLYALGGKAAYYARSLEYEHKTR